jgi:hypothetical protein
VTINGVAAAKVPDISIEFWDDDTMAQSIVGQINTADPCRATTGTTLLGGEMPAGLGTTFPLIGPLPGAAQVSLAIGLPLL